MTTDKKLEDMFDTIIRTYTKQMEGIAHEYNSQEGAEPNTLLNDGIKKHCDMSLSILVKLYGEYIKTDHATVKDALEKIRFSGEIKNEDDNKRNSKK